MVVLWRRRMFLNSFDLHEVERIFVRLYLERCVFLCLLSVCFCGVVCWSELCMGSV